MKRTLLTALLLAAATTPFAQPMDVPKPNCEPTPEYPGRLAMQSDTRRKSFERELATYKECMDKYLADRKASLKANEESANAAINDYNAVMKKINAAQTAAND